MIELYAIVAYLADKHIDKGLAPAFTDFKACAQYYQWLFFCIDTVEDFFSRYQKLSKMSDEYQKQWGEYVRDKTFKILSTLEKQLLGKDYLLGNFSAVDTCMGYALDSICEELFFNDYPNIKAYYQRLSARPACIKSEIFKR